MLLHLQSKLSAGHAFGRAFQKLKNKYTVALTADAEARAIHMQNQQIGKPPRGILASKTQRSRRDQFDRTPQTLQGVSQAFEIDIQMLPKQGVIAKDKPKYRLR